MSRTAAGQSWTVHNIGKRIMFGCAYYVAGHAVHSYDPDSTTKLYLKPDNPKIKPFTYHTGGPSTDNFGRVDTVGGSWASCKESLAISWRVEYSTNPYIYFKGRMYTLPSGGATPGFFLACSIRKAKANKDLYDYEFISVHYQFSPSNTYFRVYGFNPDPPTGNFQFIREVLVPGGFAPAQKSQLALTSNGRGFYTPVVPGSGGNAFYGATEIKYYELSDTLLSCTESAVVPTATLPNRVITSGPDAEGSYTSGNPGSCYSESCLMPDDSLLVYEIVTTLVSRVVNAASETVAVVPVQFSNGNIDTITFGASTTDVSSSLAGYTRAFKVSPIRDLPTEFPTSFDIEVVNPQIETFSYNLSGSQRIAVNYFWPYPGFISGVVVPGTLGTTNERVPVPDPGAMYSNSSGSGTLPSFFEVFYAHDSGSLLTPKSDVIRSQKAYGIEIPSGSDITALFSVGGVWFEESRVIHTLPLEIQFVKDAVVVSSSILTTFERLASSEYIVWSNTGSFYRPAAVYNKGMVLIQGSTIATPPQLFSLVLNRSSRQAVITLGSLFAKEYALSL